MPHLGYMRFNTRVHLHSTYKIITIPHLYHSNNIHQGSIIIIPPSHTSTACAPNPRASAITRSHASTVAARAVERVSCQSTANKEYSFFQKKRTKNDKGDNRATNDGGEE